MIPCRISCGCAAKARNSRIFLRFAPPLERHDTTILKNGGVPLAARAPPRLKPWTNFSSVTGKRSYWQDDFFWFWCKPIGSAVRLKKLKQFESNLVLSPSIHIYDYVFIHSELGAEWAILMIRYPSIRNCNCESKHLDQGQERRKKPWKRGPWCFLQQF